MRNIRIGLYLHVLFYQNGFSLFFRIFFDYPLTAKIYSFPNFSILLTYLILSIGELSIINLFTLPYTFTFFIMFLSLVTILYAI